MRVEQFKPVLLVDDSPTISRIICGMLGQIGFRDVDQIGNGLDALVRLHAKSYSMVLSDWHMEPMSGYELLKHIRSNEGLSRVCFLMISAESSIENVIAARKAQADSYLIKPFSAEALRVKIEEAFKTRSAALRRLTAERLN
jgi:two-component system, chemotaxis family, chemotaxis protein CheY